MKYFNGFNFESSHISSIEIRQGNDDYEYTKRVVITSAKEDDLIITTMPMNGPSAKRLRGEPQIIVTIRPEGEGLSEKQFVISHHKGSIYFELLDSI